MQYIFIVLKVFSLSTGHSKLITSMKSNILILFSVYILGSTKTDSNAETLPMSMPQTAKEIPYYFQVSHNDNQTLTSSSESTVHHRHPRQCSMENLSLIQGSINIALEHQIEKMLRDGYVDKHPQSPGCIHYTGITMSFPIRLFIRELVANAVTDYKMELLRPF